MSDPRMTTEELKSKVSLGSILIQMLSQEDDPRAAAAIEELQEQQRKINEIIKAQEVQPPPIVILCKPLVLKARALR